MSHIPSRYTVLGMSQPDEGRVCLCLEGRGVGCCVGRWWRAFKTHPSSIGIHCTVQVNLSLCLIKRHILSMYERVEFTVHCIRNLGFRWLSGQIHVPASLRPKTNPIPIGTKV